MFLHSTFGIRHSAFGIPKITDFGLAKRLDAATELTGSGAIMGTPTHMAPEQAAGQTKHVGPAADQYALGVMLYQLLTRRLPFAAETVPELLRQITEEEPVSPLRHDASLPSDLAVICLKCLAKDPGQRYPSAEALADDLRNWREHRPNTARPATRTERVIKWCRRYPAVAALLFTTTLAAIIASVAAVWALRAEGLAQDAANAERQAKERAQQDRDDKEKARQKEEEERRYAQAIADFMRNDFLALSSVEGQGRFKGDVSGLLGKDATMRDLLNHAARKLDQRKDLAPRIEAELRWMIGVTSRYYGDHVQAVAFLERSVALRQKLFGDLHEETLDAQHSLAVAYRDAGKVSEAIRLRREMQTVWDRKFALGHLDSRAALNNLAALALAYQADGKLSEALRLFEQVRSAMVKQLGPDHSDTLQLLVNLAGAYHAAGRLPEAIKLLEQVSKAHGHNRGPDHPQTLAANHKLALAYSAAGKLHQAIRLLEQVRAAQESKLGADHLDTLATLVSLGGVYHDAGRLSEAIKILERATSVTEVARGPEHPETLTARCNLATAYYAARKLPEAIRLYEQVRPAMATKLGPENPQTLTMLANLGMAYMDTGKLQEAIVLLEQVRAIQETKLGPDHLETLSTRNGLAGAYFYTGNHGKAIQLYKQVLAAVTVKLGSGHPHTLTTTYNLARAYQINGESQTAIHFYERAATGFEKRRFLDQIASRVISNTSAAYEEAMQWDKAEAWRRKWLAFLKSRGGPVHADYPVALCGLGMNLVRQQRWSEAEILLSECLVQWNKQLPDQWTTFNCMSFLGTALMGQGKYAEAEPFLLKGYKGLKQRASVIPHEVKSWRLLEAATQLVDLYTFMEKPDEVKKWQVERSTHSLPFWARVAASTRHATP